MDLNNIASRLDWAALNGQAIDQLSGIGNTVDLKQAYKVQQLLMAQRFARGEQRIGIKMGFTSRAKMLQMGVDDLIWGTLTDAMLVNEGGELKLSNFVHPRVEPEIAFLLKKPLTGQVSLPEAMQAVEAVAPAMEIIDSRYRDFKFSLEDVVADNASSSGFAVGGWHSRVSDISNLGMVMNFDGRPVATGTSAAILGNPYRSLVNAARLAAQSGIELEAGWIVLAGAATAAYPLTADIHVKTEVEQLGSVSFSVAGD